MITALALMVLSQCVAPTESIASDAPHAVIVVDATANVIDGAGKAGFVTLPKGLYLNELGTIKIEKRFSEMQVTIVTQSATIDALTTKVDEVVASEGGKVDVKTVFLIGGGMLLAGAAAGFGIAYSVKK